MLRLVKACLTSMGNPALNGRMEWQIMEWFGVCVSAGDPVNAVRFRGVQSIACGFVGAGQAMFSDSAGRQLQQLS